MKLISLLLFSISSNLDNVPVGIAYSLNKAKISFSNIFKISFVTSLITLFIMLIGTNISSFLSIKLANNIGSFILISIGIYGIIKELLNKKEEEIKISSLSTKNTILLLSVNNLATGLSASVAGLNCILSTIFTFIFSILFLYLGIFISKKIKEIHYSNICSYLSSIIVLILGIIELLFNR